MLYGIKIGKSYDNPFFIRELFKGKINANNEVRTTSYIIFWLY